MSDEPYAKYWEASYYIKNRTLVIMPECRDDLSILPNATMLTPQLVDFIERAVQCHIPIHDIDSLIMPDDMYYPEPAGQYDDEIDYKTVYRQLRDVIRRLKTVEMLGKSQCEYDLFSGLVNLKKVVLGYEMSSGSFKNCTALSSVQMPNVRCIDTGAFQGCKSLQFIQLPNADQILTNSFRDCDTLKMVEAPWVSKIMENTFHGCQELAVVYTPKVTKIAKNAFPYPRSNTMKLLIAHEDLVQQYNEYLSSTRICPMESGCIDHEIISRISTEYWLSRGIDPAVTRVITKQAIVDWGRRRGISVKDNRSLIALYRLHHEAQYRPSWSELSPFCPVMPFWQLLKHLPKDKRDHTLPKLGNAVQSDIDSMTEDELWDAYMVQSGMPLEQISVCGYKETLTLSHIAKLLKINATPEKEPESSIVRENRLVASSPAQQALFVAVSAAKNAIAQALEALATAAVSLLSWTRSGPSL